MAAYQPTRVEYPHSDGRDSHFFPGMCLLIKLMFALKIDCGSYDRMGGWLDGVVIRNDMEMLPRKCEIYYAASRGRFWDN